MYTFSIKDNSPDINVAVTTSLLALAAVTSLLYQNNQFYFINIAAAIILIMAAVFIKRLLKKLQFNTTLLLSLAAVILFVATRSIPFAAILMLYGLLVKKIYKNPLVTVNTKGISITKMLGNPIHEWSEFNNIILKDSLLTLDFKNNKLFQLNIRENNVDENCFNIFCSGYIGM
ncbi:MAG: hypothetical protein H7320_02055 [Ferruginibacter sp.]|nr:hypothetical protein [Ferruginibacter sp.]